MLGIRLSIQARATFLIAAEPVLKGITAETSLKIYRASRLNAFVLARVVII